MNLGYFPRKNIWHLMILSSKNLSGFRNVFSGKDWSSKRSTYRWISTSKIAQHITGSDDQKTRTSWPAAAAAAPSSYSRQPSTSLLQKSMASLQRRGGGATGVSECGEGREWGVDDSNNGRRKRQSHHPPHCSRRDRLPRSREISLTRRTPPATGSWSASL